MNRFLHLFLNLYRHKIQLHCDAKNIASKTIAEQNGYTLEGVIRQDAKWPNGSIRDKLYFGKLKSEWKKK